MSTSLTGKSVQERNKELALSMVASWNRGEVQGIVKHWSPDVRHFSEDRPVPSEPMIKAMEGALVGFPDLHLEVKSIVAEGDRVCLRITVTASHQGEFLGKAPTGQAVSWFMLEELLFNEAGQVIEHYDVANYLPMLDKLGLAPSHQL
ncbi:hypothetical protein GCM10010232_57350 [Streptomyces amakusaensis]|uniref:Ester cyclase n=1 Tax=Streptomyces amakusaensis TaxID=67271 RepID=A0ABW0ATL3_9ACTN